MAREEVEAGHLPPPPPGPPPMGGGKFRIDSQAMVSQQVEKVESAWLDAWQVRTLLCGRRWSRTMTLLP
jgi:hypothetical protein